MKLVIAIDDSKVTLLQITKYTQNIYPDCEVLTFTNPEDGVVTIRQRSKEIDRVIVDFNMKEMTGMEVIEAIRDIYPTQNIIVCTANTQKLLSDRVVETGATFLEKPLTPAKLEEIIGPNPQSKAS